MTVKKIAIMQPYIFPYIGYFQLVQSVNEFVFYDDVNFIKKGWVNRNNILVNGESNRFTIPLNKQSQNFEIKDTLIKKEVYFKWASKFLKSVNQHYKKAPFYDTVYPMLEKVFLHPRINSISDLSSLSVTETSQYLNIGTNFSFSSQAFSESKTLGRADRLISIVSKLEGTEYINSIGGIELYDKNYFKKFNIDLKFIYSETPVYQQYQNEFVPGLSIIDVLMFNQTETINQMLKCYKLI